MTYWKSNDQIDNWRKTENFIVLTVEAFASQKARETFLTLCTVLNIILTPDFLTNAFITQ